MKQKICQIKNRYVHKWGIHKLCMSIFKHFVLGYTLHINYKFTEKILCFSKFFAQYLILSHVEKRQLLWMDLRKSIKWYLSVVRFPRRHHKIAGIFYTTKKQNTPAFSRQVGKWFHFDFFEFLCLLHEYIITKKGVNCAWKRTTK